MAMPAMSPTIRRGVGVRRWGHHAARNANADADAHDVTQKSGLGEEPESERNPNDRPPSRLPADGVQQQGEAERNRGDGDGGDDARANRRPNQVNDQRPNGIEREIRPGLRPDDDGGRDAHPMGEPGALEQDITRQVVRRVLEREVSRGHRDRDVHRERDPKRAPL